MKTFVYLQLKIQHDFFLMFDIKLCLVFKIIYKFILKYFIIIFLFSILIFILEILFIFINSSQKPNYFFEYSSFFFFFKKASRINDSYLENANII
jgi:hypothetical protein